MKNFMKLLHGLFALILLSGCENTLTFTTLTPLPTPTPTAYPVTVTSISPTETSTSTLTTLTLTGTSFSTDTTPSIGGSPCIAVSVLSSTLIRCTYTTSSYGYKSVSVLNANGQIGIYSGYLHVTAPAPTITAISSTTGYTAGGASFTVTGTGFLTGATVTLGGYTCTSPTQTGSTSIQCTLPPHTVGTVSVKVTNPDYQSATASSSFSFIVPTAAPSNLNYTKNPAFYPLGLAITDNTPIYFTSTTIETAPTSYSISPSLPTGLSMSTVTGIISGTPTVATSTATYVITATNSAGSTTTSLILAATDFGSGATGSKTISGSEVLNSVHTVITDASVIAGATSFDVDSVTGFSASDKILIIQMQRASTAVFNWEFATISSIAGLTVNLSTGLTYPYVSGTLGTITTQVLLVPQYTDLTVGLGTSITTDSWSSSTGTGGVIALMVSGTLTVNGTINATGVGFTGGAAGNPATGSGGFAGQSWVGSGTQVTTQNSGGGGGAFATTAVLGVGHAGAGGGHGTAGGAGSGANGQATVGNNSWWTLGVNPLASSLFLGPGGGGGSNQLVSCTPAAGSPGGGIILIYASSLFLGPQGTLSAKGLDSMADPVTGCSADAGGGGAGGSIYLKSSSMNIGIKQVSAVGGATDLAAKGGAGGSGRIRLDFGSLTGTSNPSAESMNPL